MNELIKVFTVITTIDDEGFSVTEETELELYAEVKSASYVDRHASNNSKVVAQIEFMVRKEDFLKCRATRNKKHFYPSFVEYEGARYELVRWRYIDSAKAGMICG